MITNVKDLADYIGIEPEKEDFERYVYRNTDCGAWIKIEENGIQLGSIVEGSDAECETYELMYPFEIEEFWASIELIEIEAEELWNEANT